MSATDTAPQPIDGPTALRLLRGVVAERPDYVYQEPDPYVGGCVYVHDGKPSCIVGHVLFRAGWPIETVAELDNYGEASAGMFTEHGLPVNAPAASVLDAAQSVQDRGDRTWAQALAAAEEKAAQLGVTV